MPSINVVTRCAIIVGSGALYIPITGYYFYEGKDVKIPIEGSCNGADDISFRARTSGGYETFKGQFTEPCPKTFPEPRAKVGGHLVHCYNPAPCSLTVSIS
ncbi:MAG: hypothetical protein ACK5XN_33830, partial [Bacteroidota bacterium]